MGRLMGFDSSNAISFAVVVGAVKPMLANGSALHLMPKILAAVTNGLVAQPSADLSAGNQAVSCLADSVDCTVHGTAAVPSHPLHVDAAMFATAAAAENITATKYSAGKLLLVAAVAETAAAAVVAVRLVVQVAQVHPTWLVQHSLGVLAVKPVRMPAYKRYAARKYVDT